MKKLRERLNITQEGLAELMNEALGRKYSSQSVSAWEVGRKKIPESVDAFLDAIALDGVAPTVTPPAPSPDPSAARQEEDTAPSDPAFGVSAGGVSFSSSGVYKRACTELWQIIGSGLGMAGAAVGSRKLMNDGLIIDADKEALGEAWGKLAETNETFRNMLVGMTSGGAWVQVAVVTGSTVARMWQNHAALSAAEEVNDVEQNGAGQPDYAAA